MVQQLLFPPEKPEKTSTKPETILLTATMTITKGSRNSEAPCLKPRALLNKPTRYIAHYPRMPFLPTTTSCMGFLGIISIKVGMQLFSNLPFAWNSQNTPIDRFPTNLEECQDESIRA